MFDPGQKVVCINGDFHPDIAKLFNHLPEEGQTYVIRDVSMGFFPVRSSKVGLIRLLLVGMVNPLADPNKPNSERGFNSDRFVPLDEFNAVATEHIKQQMEAHSS